MKKLNIAFLFFFILSSPAFCQQDPLTSHYMFNTMTYNPGFAGTSGMICATAINRQQWVGFQGAPSTILFNVAAPVSPFRIKSGVGLLVESDNAGFDRDIFFSGSYSYLIDVGNGVIGLGFSAGMVNKTISPEWVIPAGENHVPAAGDPLIPENKESFVAFDAGLGLYYRTEKYYAGLSVTHLTQPEIKFTKGTPYLSRHYYLTAGYTLPLPNPSLELLPSFFAFSDGKVLQANATAMIRYNKKVWGGISYRAGDAIIGMIGLELFNGIRIGYSYDFTTSDLSKGSGGSNGSHEFLVNYCFDLSLGKSPMKYKSIRFL
ncbi:MAG TPA: type IX secretion system membrane protein PorP/SprF [Bacteroidales bacterium]|nr:type IX secretion system membrane protein PorP/SprF [Bacteroidales bacterium]